MEIWRYGDMVIWRYGDMSLDFTFDLFISRRVREMIWRYGDMEIWRYGTSPLTSLLTSLLAGQSGRCVFSLSKNLLRRDD
jgi:hypothetical protein